MHHHQPQQISSDYKQTQISAAEHREKYYATVRKPMGEQQSPTGNLERIPEYSEDIYPYATFHLPDEENLSGNPMLMSRYSASSNAGTIPISANLYNSRNSMSSAKEVCNAIPHTNTILHKSNVDRIEPLLMSMFSRLSVIIPPESFQYEFRTKFGQHKTFASKS